MSNSQATHFFKTSVIAVIAALFIQNLAFAQTVTDLQPPEEEVGIEEYTSETYTFSFEETISTEPFSDEEIIANIKEFVTTPDNGTNWETFGETKQIPYSYEDSDGYELNGVRPEFTENLKQLDGTTVILQGFMFPLGQEQDQETFLFGPFPVSCPFHYHVKPNLLIEAHAKETVKFSYDPINIKGTLELIYQDDEYNLFYKLKNVSLIND